MKRMIKFISVFIFLLYLGGCTTVTKLPKFPEQSEELKTFCPELSLAGPDSKLSDLLMVITENYTKYHECAGKVDAWIMWYNKHKKNYEELK